MRRRDYFRINVQTQDGVVPVVTTEHVGTLETFGNEPVVKAEYIGEHIFEPKGIELRKTGQCSKCGKIIGRGLYFHTKSCRGTMDLK